ncbi:MAG: class I SAM-dependent methyltransferase [Pseudomonadota bacterium]
MKTDPPQSCSVNKVREEDYPDHGRLMDRIYRDQRHIYDVTRRCFLLGRDTLLERMKFKSDDKVLEIGCGTARNLIRIARMHSSVRLYGLDVSEDMLKTARAKVLGAGLQDRIHLRKCPAGDLDYRDTFGCTSPFRQGILLLYAVYDPHVEAGNRRSIGQYK